MNSSHFWLTLTGLSGVVAVIMGAFGAHGLESRLSEHYLEVFNTGFRYHIYHTLALLAAALHVGDPALSRRLVRASWAWLAGILVFSGSLYLLALTQMRWLGMITPFGGVAFIVGWAFLAFGCRRFRSS